jgi:hypothetical protein
MVLTVSSGGKKWSLHYHCTGIGGKKWGIVYTVWGYKTPSRDYPHANASPDILTNPNFYP